MEGFTNLLWTVMLAAPAKLGWDLELFAKAAGVGCGVLVLVGTWELSRRSRIRGAPIVAPWLLASSISSTAFAVSGLETMAVTLILVALALTLLREREHAELFPLSGIVLGVGCWLRPELPLFGGVLILGFCGAPRTRREMLRVALVAIALAALLGFRLWYFATWLPNTYVAKVGRPGALLGHGLAYVGSFGWSTLPIGCLAMLGLAARDPSTQRPRLVWGAAVLAVVVVTVLAGGDWMAGWRFLVPAEPFYYLLVEAGVAWVWVERSRVVRGAAVAACLALAGWRVALLRGQQREIVLLDEAAWERAVTPLARWLAAQPRGLVAVGDIGRIGWFTDFPIYDRVGLVDPQIARQRQRALLRRPNSLRADFVAARPRYVVFPTEDPTCAAESNGYGDLLDLKGFMVARKFGGGRESTWCVLASSRIEDATGLDQR